MTGAAHLSTDATGPNVRIGLFTPRFGLFDAAMPEGFPAARRRFAARAAERLGERFDVDHPMTIESAEDAAAVAAAWAAAELDVVVCWPTMAAPPGWLEAVLDARPDLPVVVVVAQESTSVPDDYDTNAATERSLPVGGVMAANVLRRRGTPMEVVVGVDGDDLVARVTDAVRLLATVRAMRRLRLGVVGAPIAGYSDVEVSSAQLEQLGVELVDIADDLEREFQLVDETAIDAEVEEVEKLAGTQAASAVLRRSARLSVALERLVDRHGLDGGAVNCHGDRLRFSDRIGITACLGVSRCSTAGRPFACTGDVPAAVALVLGRRVAGAALYCELYQLHLDDDWILVANGGEGDWTLRDPSRPLRLLPEDHYRGDHGPGVASAFSVAQGLATLCSLSPGIGAGGGWGLVAAEGAVVDARHDSMEGPNAMFRFDGLRVDDAYRRWCELGATHHAVLVPGRHLASFERLGGHVGFDVLDVVATARRERHR